MPTDSRAICATCGARLPTSGADAGLCGACLVRMALDDEAATASVARGGLRENTSIGPYRLVEKIGEGGMGVVYRAEQKEPVRRTVAVKLIRGEIDTEQVVARFEAERQALALMDHPGIARIHDAGTCDDGRPYFVMEYVAGDPVTTYCDRRRLGTGDRLALFVEVCDAVQHAHHRGVIHRDLKPANVLVTERDGKPAVRIIDFGIAKATQHKLTTRTLVTQLGLAIGTPEYMSPEQASGTGLDVDTRTDVYSLGVLLYELLVGALPFEPADLRRVAYDEVLRRIREDDPPRPSQRLSTLGESSRETAARRGSDVRSLGRRIRGDLDWIVMKALEKDRNRRYGSPGELAGDITRHLADDPVDAGPPSAVYRARKFIRRHRLGVAVAATAVVALLATALGTSFGLVRALRAEREARESEQTAERVSTFLVDLFRTSDASVSQQGELTARELFDAGAERVDRELAGEPLMRARMLRTFGEVYLNLGHLDEAQKRLDEAIRIERESGRRKAVATTAEILANLHYQRHELQEARALAMEALEVWNGLGVDDDPALAEAYYVLGSCARMEGNTVDAETNLERALEVLSRASPEFPRKIFRTRAQLASVYWNRGNLARFVAESREALDYARSENLGDSIATLNVQGWLGLGYWGQGDLEEAERVFRQTLDSQRALIDGDSPLTLDTLWNVVDVVREQGRNDEAAALGVDLVAACERVVGRHDRETVAAMFFTAESLRRAGRLGEAADMYRDVGARARGIDPPAEGAETVVACQLEILEAIEAADRLTEAISACAQRLDRIPDVSHMSLGRRGYLDMAQLAAESGLPELSVGILEKIVARGYADPLLAVGASFAALRDDPRFRDLIQRMSSQP